MASRGLRVLNSAQNQNERNKLTKRGQDDNVEGKKNEPLPAKRAALGTLSSNVRIQPFRAVKVCMAQVNVLIPFYLKFFHLPVGNYSSST